MSSPTRSELGHAILTFVERDDYPESDLVVSADLAPSAVPAALKLLSDAREAIRDRVRGQSRDVSAEVDAWLAQARQLQRDVGNAEAAAREIARLDQEGDRLEKQVRDLANKHQFLRREISFNQKLFESLEALNADRNRLRAAEDSLANDDIASAVQGLRSVEDDIEASPALQETSALNLLRVRVAEVRIAVADKLTTCWNSYVALNTDERRLLIRQIEDGHSQVALGSTVAGLNELGLLGSQLELFSRSLQEVIIGPLLSQDYKSGARRTLVEDDGVQVQEVDTPATAGACVKDIRTLLNFLNGHLPTSVTLPLSMILLPKVTAVLITQWLNPSLPVGLDGLVGFCNVLADVDLLCDLIETFGWQGEANLKDWVEDVPYSWLNKRRDDILDLTRSLMLCQLGPLKRVERTETQRVSSNDHQLVAEGNEDGKHALPDFGKHFVATDASSPKEVEDGDMSAWGIEDDGDGSGGDQGAEDPNDLDDAWGFNQDTGDDTQAMEKQDVNGQNTRREDKPPYHTSPSEHDMTLRETYCVSYLPDSILRLMDRTLRDFFSLLQPASNAPYKAVAPAATGLVVLPPLVLSMYRALSPRHYQKHDSGNMLLYNDAMWLGEQLRKLNEDLSNYCAAKALKPGRELSLTSDAIGVENFAKSAYRKEMDIQRARLADLLEPARGFENCTVEPFSARCDAAVNGVVSHLRQLNISWKGVLSRSALLQSLGSLLSNVVHTIMTDIEDMSDISELESNQLATLCGRISGLEDLFLPDDDAEPTKRRGGDGGEEEDEAGHTMPLTAIYTPNWFKFQFLVNILESTLADIRYLWTEGELGLEFSADEVIELIEALFADSEVRRRTIGDIKRGSTASR